MKVLLEEQMETNTIILGFLSCSGVQLYLKTITNNQMKTNLNYIFKWLGITPMSISQIVYILSGHV